MPNNNRTISDECWIQAITTGETLHPQLLHTKPLSQGYNSAKTLWLPNWTVQANQPVIYLSQLSEGIQIEPYGTPQWWYNNEQLSFDADGYSTVKDANNRSLFKRETKTLSGKSMPALRIYSNLAGPNNINLDIVGYKGKVELSGVLFDVDLELPVKLAEWSGTGYNGQMTFQDITRPSAPVNDVTAITEKGQVLRATPHLYKDIELTAGTDYFCKWLLNGSVLTNNANAQTVNVSEGDILDHGVLVCEFYSDSQKTKLLTVISQDIDDLQDPEFLYIQHRKRTYNTGTQQWAWSDYVAAKNCKLRKDEKVQYKFWMGLVDNAAVDTSWSEFLVQFRGKGGSLLAPANMPCLNTLQTVTIGSTTWYKLPVSSGVATTSDSTSTTSGAIQAISFAHVTAQGDGVSLFIMVRKT